MTEQQQAKTPIAPSESIRLQTNRFTQLIFPILLLSFLPYSYDQLADKPGRFATTAAILLALSLLAYIGFRHLSFIELSDDCLCAGTLGRFTHIPIAQITQISHTHRKGCYSPIPFLTIQGETQNQAEIRIEISKYAFSEKNVDQLVTSLLARNSNIQVSYSNYVPEEQSVSLGRGHTGKL